MATVTSRVEEIFAQGADDRTLMANKNVDHIRKALADHPEILTEDVVMALLAELNLTQLTDLKDIYAVRNRIATLVSGGAAPAPAKAAPAPAAAAEPELPAGFTAVAETPKAAEPVKAAEPAAPTGGLPSGLPFGKPKAEAEAPKAEVKKPTLAANRSPVMTSAAKAPTIDVEAAAVVEAAVEEVVAAIEEAVEETVAAVEETVAALAELPGPTEMDKLVDEIVDELPPPPVEATTEAPKAEAPKRGKVNVKAVSDVDNIVKQLLDKLSGKDNELEALRKENDKLKAELQTAHTNVVKLSGTTLKALEKYGISVE